jgi:hypothetical protein
MAKKREEWGDYKLFEAIHRDMNGMLYHLTDRANLHSIKTHGLLSREEAKARGVCSVRPGGNGLTIALDNQRGLQDYVFLSFHENVTMPKDDRIDHLRQPIFVYVDPAVVLWEGAMVSLGRSTRSDIFNTKRAYWEMDWEIFENPELRSNLSRGVNGPARWNSFFSYEVLLPKSVPPEFIVIDCDN